MTKQHSTQSDSPGDFNRFESLARRILTTPKADLVKSSPPKTEKASKPAKKK